MKKLCLTLLTVLSCGAAFALPVGNPSDAALLTDGVFWNGCCDPCAPYQNWFDGFNFRAGFYGDYVFNRHLESRGSSPFVNRVEHSTIFTNAGYLAVNFCNRAQVFATLGTSRFNFETNSDFPGIFGRLEFDYHTDFSWSVGGSAVLWECGCTALGIEGQYFRADPRIERVTFRDSFSVYPEDPRLGYREWQVGLGLSHRINIFVPYVAVKWARARTDGDGAFTIFVPVLEEDVTFLLPGLRNEKDWGWAVGVSIIDRGFALATIEARFADEKAIYVNGQVRF